MNLHRLLLARAAAGQPLRVGLIGAGKFGAMYLAQAKHTAGIHIVGIADLAPNRASAALSRTGWAPQRFAARSFAEALKSSATHLTDDAPSLIAAPEIEIVIDATGDPGGGNPPRAGVVRPWQARGDGQRRSRRARRAASRAPRA